jgi:endonuclease/exonuclease/phosphatase family metal-dependent hydrolase
MRHDSFKIGTFNLYNLALPDRPYYDRRYSTEDYNKKIEWSAEQLRRMDADIVGFQEVFHTEALQQLLTVCGRYHDAPVLVAGGTGEGPSVGLVSRFPVITHEIIPNFPEPARLEIDDLKIPLTQFSRPVLKVRVEIAPDLKATFFVVHLKSKRPLVKEEVDPHDPTERALGHARSLMVRSAEAAALRYLLVEELHGTNQPVVVMGDFNDSDGAVTSRIISGSPPWRSLPREQKRQVWDVLLYNVKEIQARQSYRDVYYTHLHNGHHESLDHIMVSQEFVRENPNRLGQVEYVANLNDHLIDDTLSDDRLPKWQTDHGQVVVTIGLRRPPAP